MKIYFNFADVSKLVTSAVVNCVLERKVYNVIIGNKISPHASSFIIDWTIRLQFDNLVTIGII